VWIACSTSGSFSSTTVWIACSTSGSFSSTTFWIACSTSGSFSVTTVWIVCSTSSTLFTADVALLIASDDVDSISFTVFCIFTVSLTTASVVSCMSSTVVVTDFSVEST
jgi:hypothetical protein